MCSRSFPFRREMHSQSHRDAITRSRRATTSETRLITGGVTSSRSRKRPSDLKLLYKKWMIGQWVIYLLRFTDNSLYVGQSLNFKRRLKEHRNRQHLSFTYE